jgi:hypothetical protein
MCVELAQNCIQCAVLILAVLKSSSEVKVSVKLSCDSSVGIATGFGVLGFGSKLPIKWVPGALSLGLKWPGREADHSPPSNAEIKNAWSYTSTPQCLHGVVLN